MPAKPAAIRQKFFNGPSPKETWVRAFPEFDWGEPVTKCGDWEIYEGTFLSQGTRCLLLPMAREFFATEEELNRFAEGMTYVRTVTHPSLLQVLGVGVRNGMACIVYEQFKGQALTTFFRPRPKAFFSVNVVGCAAEALHAAHLKGVAHGDVNPAWILVSETGQVKLAGLGAARLLYPTNSKFYEATLSRSPALRVYIAPEQLDDEIPTTHQTDIYALGSLAYHLLTGSPIGGFIILPSSRKEVGSFTDDVIFKSTLKDPTARQDTAEKFAADIRRIGGGVENSHWAERQALEKKQKEMRARRSRRRNGILAAVVIAGLIGGGIYYAENFYRSHDKEWFGPEGTLSKAAQARQLITKGQKEAAFALISAAMQELASKSWVPSNGDELEGLSFAAVALGEEELAIRTGTEILAKMPKDSPDWERLAALTNLLSEGRKYHSRSLESASKLLEKGDKAAARAELARADAYLPNHPAHFAEKAKLDYDPIPALKAVLEKTLLPGGGPLEYALREDGLQIHLDLSHNISLENVSFLRGHPVTHLDLSHTSVHNLLDIANLPLHVLHLDHTNVKDLRHLRGGTLRELTAEGATITEFGLIERSVFLTNFRIGLPKQAMKKRTSRARRGQSWINELGMRFSPMHGSNSVLFGDWETRLADYRAYATATALEPTPGMVTKNESGQWSTSPHSWSEHPEPQTEDHPVVGISFAEAKAFCEWLTKTALESGHIPAKAHFRLPTSEEWTQATGLVSADKKSAYPWGDTWPPDKLSGNYPPIPLTDNQELTDPFQFTSPVGSFRNLCPHRDMGGNVREWCIGDLPDKAVLRDASRQADARDFPRLQDALKLEAETSAPADLHDSTAGFRVVLDFGL